MERSSVGDLNNSPDMRKRKPREGLQNDLLKGENQNACCLRSETRQECLHSLLPFNIILAVLARSIRQEKKR